MTRVHQHLLRGAGAVALAAGTHQVVTGGSGVLGARGAALPASVDSELRFYAAWYAAAGALMLRASRDPRVDQAVTVPLALGWLGAAGGRVLSMRSAGRPHPLFQALAAVEVAVGCALLAGRRRRS